VIDPRLLAGFGVFLVCVSAAGRLLLRPVHPGPSGPDGGRTLFVATRPSAPHAGDTDRDFRDHGAPVPRVPDPAPWVPRVASKPLRPPPLEPEAVAVVERPVSSISEEERQQRLDHAINALRRRDPELSAATTLTRTQRRGLLILIALVVLGLVLNYGWTLIALTGISTSLYLGSLLFRIRLFRLSLGEATAIQVSEQEALALTDDELPVYSVMVPAFREPEVVAKLIESLGKLDYPAAKLQIILLLEEDDTETVEAAFSSPGVERFEVVLVPEASPRTKPKALNYGLQFARGEFVTIFDAEDRPEPLQLRRALIAMRRAGEDVACLQAELAYFNPTQNMITRWFTIEYLMWFTQLLPGLSYLDAPVPLGGTSNHFRRAVLESLGGWDPFNVTEDADLGVRLHRLGYRTGVLASETLEEANSDFVNWVKQRSRWYKGYIQTWIVHMRHPRQLRQELGNDGFVRFNSFVGGTPFLALVNPLFWFLTIIWFTGHPEIIKAIYPSPIFYSALACWLAGNFVCVYVLMLCAVQAKRTELFVAAVINPVYWVMMSLAALKAFIQIVFQPSYWEKTMHGLDTASQAAAAEAEIPEPSPSVK
jgi:cellulose synthase/poly-beta-1,6-N-acetylglucosamine synthase-like glycosyltransferase